MWKYDVDRTWAYNFIAAVAQGEKIPQELAFEWTRFGYNGVSPVSEIIFQVIKDLKLQKIEGIKLYRTFTNEGLAESKTAVERACFPIYRFTDEGLTYAFWAAEKLVALNFILGSALDRFRKVGENQYRLVDSNSVATYIIPDRFLKLA